MKVASTRLPDETMAAVAERAAARNLTVGEIIREAIEAYLTGEEEPMPVLKEQHLPATDCPHPPSRRLQLSNGVLCDRCGTWLVAGQR